MRCTKCGADVSDNAKNCEYCGTEVEKKQSNSSNSLKIDLSFINDIIKQSSDISKAAFINTTANGETDTNKTNNTDSTDNTNNANPVKFDLGFNPEDIFKQVSNLTGAANSATDLNRKAWETKQTAREINRTTKSVRRTVKSARTMIVLVSVLITVVVLASILIPVLIYAGKLKNNEDGDTTGANSSHIEVVVPPEFSINSVISSITILTVSGSVKNNYDKTITKFTITLTFYDETDKSISTQKLTKNNFASGETWNYTQGNVYVYGLPVKITTTSMTFN